MAWCKECSEWRQYLEMAEEIIKDKSKTIDDLINEKNELIKLITAIVLQCPYPLHDHITKEQWERACRLTGKHY